jgi:hypothetical protein
MVHTSLRTSLEQLGFPAVMIEGRLAKQADGSGKTRKYRSADPLADCSDNRAAACNHWPIHPLGGAEKIDHCQPIDNATAGCHPRQEPSEGFFRHPKALPTN